MRPFSCRIAWLIVLSSFMVLTAVWLSGCDTEVVEPEDPDAPVINSLTADPPVIGIRGRVTLKCVAADPEYNKDFTFTWSRTAGSFVNTQGDSTTHPDLSVHANYATWIAPDSPQDVTITVTVDDGTNSSQETTGVSVTSYELIQYWGMVEAVGDSAHHPGFLSMPRGLAIFGDYCYVADYGNDRLQRFDKDTGAYDTLWTQAITATDDTLVVDGPIDVAADASGNIFLVDFRRIYRFAAVGPDLQFTNYVSLGDSFSVSLDMDAAGNLYLCNSDGGSIAGYNNNLGPLGNQVSGLDVPRGITIDSNDNLYVVDYDRFAVPDTVAPDSVVYDTTTTTWILRYDAPGYIAVGDTIGQYGEGGDGNLFAPFALAWSTLDDGLFVTDMGGMGDPLLTRVVMYSGDGTYQLDWGSAGTGLQSFSVPLGIAVDDEGAVYISDTGNDAIKKFAP